MIIWARIYGIFTRVTIKIHHSWNIHLARLLGSFFWDISRSSTFPSWPHGNRRKHLVRGSLPRTACEFEFHTDRHRIHVYISFTCIYLMFVWNLGVYVYTIHGSYEIGFYRIFTKHVVLALSGPSLFCKPSTTNTCDLWSYVPNM